MRHALVRSVAWRHGGRVEHAMFQSSHGFARPVWFAEANRCRCTVLHADSPLQCPDGHTSQIRQRILAEPNLPDGKLHLSKNILQVCTLCKRWKPRSHHALDGSTRLEVVPLACEHQLTIGLKRHVQAVLMEPKPTGGQGLHLAHCSPFQTCVFKNLLTLFRTAVRSEDLSQLAGEASQVQSILLQLERHTQEGQELLQENVVLQVRATVLDDGLPGCTSDPKYQKTEAETRGTESGAHFSAPAHPVHCLHCFSFSALTCQDTQDVAGVPTENTRGPELRVCT